MSVTTRCAIARTLENARFFLLSVFWYILLSLLGFGFYTGLKYDQHIGIIDGIDERENVHEYCKEHGITEDEYYDRVRMGNVLLSNGKRSSWQSDISHEMIARYGIDVESMMIQAFSKELESEVDKELLNSNEQLKG